MTDPFVLPIAAVFLVGEAHSIWLQLLGLARWICAEKKKRIQWMKKRMRRKGVERKRRMTEAWHCWVDMRTKTRRWRRKTGKWMMKTKRVG